MTQINSSTWKRIVIDVPTIVGSILLAFAIDAWWDEFRDREDAEIVLSSLHDELVELEEFISWQGQFVKAINYSAKQLLTAAVGEDRKLGEREIDRLLADLTWFVSGTIFDVPELESLVRNDELFFVRQRVRTLLGSGDDSVECIVELEVPNRRL